MTSRTIQNQVVTDVLAERIRQDAKWGEQNHEPEVYLSVLVEEVGEAAQEMLRMRFGNRDAFDLRAELVQVAAVAVAMVECLDRGKWRYGVPTQDVP